MVQPEQAAEYNPEKYTLDLKHELRVRGMPDMDLTCNIHDDGFLAVFISNCSSTGFTLQAEIPEGANYKPKRMMEYILKRYSKVLK